MTPTEDKVETITDNISMNLQASEKQLLTDNPSLMMSTWSWRVGNIWMTEQ